MLQNKKIVGGILVLISSFFYASYGIWTKLMGDFFAGYTASALRSIVVFALLLPVVVFYKSLEPLCIKTNYKYIIGMFVASLFTWGPLYYAILHAGVGISLTISYASIVVGALFFGWLFGKEKFTKDKIVPAIFGIIGLCLIFSPTTKNVGWLALLGALMSGLSAGANMVFSKKINYKPAQTTIVLWTSSVLANVIMAFLTKEHSLEFEWNVAWLWLFIFAAASILASWTLVKGIKLVEAGTASIIGLFEIVFAVLFGLLLFGEKLDGLALIGILIIILSALFPYIKRKPKVKKV